MGESKFHVCTLASKPTLRATTIRRRGWLCVTRCAADLVREQVVRARAATTREHVQRLGVQRIVRSSVLSSERTA